MYLYRAFRFLCLSVCPSFFFSRCTNPRQGSVPTTPKRRIVEIETKGFHHANTVMVHIINKEREVGGEAVSAWSLFGRALCRGEELETVAG